MFVYFIFYLQKSRKKTSDQHTVAKWLFRCSLLVDRRNNDFIDCFVDLFTCKLYTNLLTDSFHLLLRHCIVHWCSCWLVFEVPFGVMQPLLPVYGVFVMRNAYHPTTVLIWRAPGTISPCLKMLNVYRAALLFFLTIWSLWMELLDFVSLLNAVVLTWSHICTCTHIDRQTDTHARTHARTHTHTHTHTQSKKKSAVMVLNTEKAKTFV